MESEASAGNDGSMRLDLIDRTRMVTRLWEQRNGNVLETTFGAHGEIITQRLLSGGRMAAEYFNDAVAETGTTPKPVDFKPIKLEKRCPKCESDALVRKIEAFSGIGIPVMPIYYCSSCKAESFYLTDEYLGYLMDNNKEMFEKEEAEKMASDRAEFAAELRRHIISIFASKKIMNIK